MRVRDGFPTVSSPPAVDTLFLSLLLPGIPAVRRLGIALECHTASCDRTVVVTSLQKESRRK